MARKTMIISAFKNIKTSMHIRRYVVWLMFWVVLVLVGISLGIWQWERADDKRELLARKNAAPMLFDPTHTPLDGAKVTLEGHYLPSYTLYLDNRTLNGRLGVAVITPFVDTNDQRWLIQRGFLETGVSRSEPSAATPTNLVTIKGEWEAAGNQGPIYGPNREGSRVQQLSLDEWSETVGEFEYSGWVHAQHGAGVLASWWQPNTIAPSRHIGYAFQWWGLSVAAFVVMLIGGHQLLKDSKNVRDCND
ncbi:SURF1 family protein [Halomonas vilamensis]|uniref:SURF1-like protein n=1 Tax=Vreelandella vilamensis TaxID=531309 RepID=A0ABU1H249_9GAMM|nr:SURF1 family protein [Halomonas vilamensis]MDR5898368.1 SURF1 family protein [Halomonas vilamensis]